MVTNRFSMILCATLLTGMLAAQSQRTQAILMAPRANATQVASWQWKQKTSVIRKSMPTGTKIDEVRVGAGGQLQRTTLVQPEEKRLGPIMARKAADIKSTVQEVMLLASRYASPQELGRAVGKGEVWEGQGTLRIQARSVVIPADEMQIVVNTASYLPTRADVKTHHEGSPVAITIDYEQLPNGPSVMRRMTVQIPDEAVVVNVDSYDFVRLATHIIP
jgi:hypothetical protein